jgi:hypothetical protein
VREDYSASWHAANLQGGIAPAIVAKQFWLTYRVGVDSCGPLYNYPYSMECGLAMEPATAYRDGGQLFLRPWNDRSPGVYYGGLVADHVCRGAFAAILRGSEGAIWAAAHVLLGALPDRK